MHNDRLDTLTDYPFDRLRTLLRGLDPPSAGEPVLMHMGEPKHQPPALTAPIIAEHADEWRRYPPPSGTSEFRQTVVDWLNRRYDLPGEMLDPDRHVALVADLTLLTTAIGLARRHDFILALDECYAEIYTATAMAGLATVLGDRLDMSLGEGE